MQYLVKMKFGSVLYGTNLPTSDTDYKAIYVPSAEEILLQKIKKSINNNTNNTNTKNKTNDIDMEIFSLDYYVKLLLDGNTCAIDMLFCSEENIMQSSPEWRWLQDNKHYFLHSGILSFVGYCRTQANKYGIKGSRMRAVKDVIEWLKGYKSHIKFRDIVELKRIVYEAENEFITFRTQVDNKGKWVEYFEVVGRKFDLGCKVGDALARLQKIYDEYGTRAQQAETNEGIDWKALMHAVRVQYEAKELLTTGKITFPRPEKDLLLKIRTGKMEYREVANIIESGLDELDKIESHLPKEPDFQMAKLFVMDIYTKQVLSDSRS